MTQVFWRLFCYRGARMIKLYKIITALFFLFPLASYANSYIVYNTSKSPELSFSFNSTKLKHFDASVMELTAEQFGKLKAKGYDIEPNGKMKVLGAPSVAVDPPADQPWGIVAVKAFEAHDITQGAGVTVCVVDTGVDDSHQELVGQVVDGENTIPGAVAPNGHPIYFDDMGHGTHVSGTIAAKGVKIFGVAPQAQIYAVKAMNQDGEGEYSWIADGIEACIGKAQIISLSLGGSNNKLIKKAVQDAQAAGLLVIAAAGNDSGPVGYPAAYPGVIAVSAVDQNLKFAKFSSYGKQIAFAAPGVKVLSSLPGDKYAAWDGTSMATPHVAGVAALMLSAQKLELKADQLPGLTTAQQGNGFIDALLTVQDE